MNKNFKHFIELILLLLIIIIAFIVVERFTKWEGTKPKSETTTIENQIVEEDNNTTLSDTPQVSARVEDLPAVADSKTETQEPSFQEDVVEVINEDINEDNLAEDTFTTDSIEDDVIISPPVTEEEEVKTAENEVILEEKEVELITQEVEVATEDIIIPLLEEELIIDEVQEEEKFEVKAFAITFVKEEPIPVIEEEIIIDEAVEEEKTEIQAIEITPLEEESVIEEIQEVKAIAFAYVHEEPILVIEEAIIENIIEEEKIVETIAWQWASEDSAIKSFRYQLNGEDDNNWTTVSSVITTCSFKDYDKEVPNTLYLQQSFDDKNWSVSGTSTIYPKGYIGPLVEPVVKQKEQVVVKEKKERVLPEYEKFDLLLGLGIRRDNTTIGDRINLEKRLSYQIDLGFSYDEIFALYKNLTLGAQYNLGLNIATSLDQMTLNKAQTSLSSEIMMNLSYKLGQNKIILSPGLISIFRGENRILGTETQSIGKTGINNGLTLTLQYRYLITKGFTLGTEVKYTCLFVNDMNPSHYIGAKLLFGYNF